MINYLEKQQQPEAQHEQNIITILAGKIFYNELFRNQTLQMVYICQSKVQVAH